MPGVPKITDDLRNTIKKNGKNRNVRFVAFCLGKKELIFDNFLKQLQSWSINVAAILIYYFRVCTKFQQNCDPDDKSGPQFRCKKVQFNKAFANFVPRLHHVVNANRYFENIFFIVFPSLQCLLLMNFVNNFGNW